jgi:hypothetical protein
LNADLEFKEIDESTLETIESSSSNTTSLDIMEKNLNETRQNLVAFYRNKPKQVWEVPVQYNESSILFYIFYALAKIIDVAIPGKREQPLLNLRFLANPITLSLVLVVLFVVSLFFKL